MNIKHYLFLDNGKITVNIVFIWVYLYWSETLSSSSLPPPPKKKKKTEKKRKEGAKKPWNLDLYSHMVLHQNFKSYFGYFYKAWEHNLSSCICKLPESEFKKRQLHEIFLMFYSFIDLITHLFCKCLLKFVPY